MQVSYSFWDIYHQYFENSILLPVFVIAGIWFFRKWNREKRIAVLLVCIASVLLLFNEVTYRVMVLVGEDSTYYRFFWICPIVLVIAAFFVEFAKTTKKERSVMVIAIFIFAGIAFLPRNLSDWTNIPDNVYQLDEDVIQVADALMELTEEQSTSLIDDGTITPIIRQYNAKIKFTEKYADYIDYILRIDTANYLGKFVRDFIRLNESEYVAMRKEKVATWKLLESAGFNLAAETDGYYIYSVDYEQIEADLESVDALEEGKCASANIDYIPITGLQGKYEYIYLSDFGVVENVEVYQELIEQIKNSTAEGVIINTGQSKNKEWTEEYRGLLDDLGIPYYCNNQSMQLIECEEFAFCLLDNTTKLQQGLLEEFKELKNLKKPIILVLSERLSDSVQDELYLAVTEADSMVVQVLTTSQDENVKEIIANKILQFATPVDAGQVFNIIRVKGLEESCVMTESL